MIAAVCNANPAWVPGFFALFMLAFIGIFVLAITAFQIFLWWKVFAKAGYSGALGLLMLIGPIGVIIMLCILAFSQWPAGTACTR